MLVAPAMATAAALCLAWNIIFFITKWKFLEFTRRFMRPPLGFMRRFMRKVYAEVYAVAHRCGELPLRGFAPLRDRLILGPGIYAIR